MEQCDEPLPPLQVPNIGTYSENIDVGRGRVYSSLHGATAFDAASPLENLQG